MADVDLRLLVPRPLRELPADLALVAGLVVGTALATLVPGLRATPLRIPLGVAFVALAPGYAAVSALFPESLAAHADGEDRNRDRGITGVERLALAFALSIVVTALTGLALNYTPWGIRLAPVVVSVGGVTLGLTALAAARRRQLPADERFSVPWREWLARTRAELLDPETRLDAALNVVLVLSILAAVGTAGFLVAGGVEDRESFTEFYLLAENETGDLVAGSYPTEFERGASRPVVVGVENHEGEPVEYAVVVELHRVRWVNESGGERVVVTEQRELARFERTVEAGGRWRRTYGVAPTMTGTDLRVAFLLYRGDPPADPTTENAYRHLQLWVNVSAPTEQVASAPRLPSGQPRPSMAAR